MYNQCLLFIITASIIYKTTSKEIHDKDSKIQDLEQKKSDLFIQINEAIDDTLTSLNGTNDTDALLTLNHIKELKKQIKELNETEDYEMRPEEIYEGSDSESRNKTNATIDRRHVKLVSDRNHKIKLDLLELVQLLKRSPHGFQSEWKNKILEEHRKIVEQKLEMWIRQREREKTKIEDYTYKQNAMLRFWKKEKCPDQGEAKAHSKSFRRRNGRRSGGKTVKPKYPCCRKCCKKSDMGCLK